MNDNHRHADLANLEPPLAAAVNAALAEPIPADAVERVKSRAKLLAANTASPAPVVRQRRWKASRRLVTALTAAAAMLIVATVGILALNGSGNQAFAQVIEKVKAATSVRFTTSMQWGKGRVEKGVMYLKGNHIRFEQFGGRLVQVGDLDRKQAMCLNVPGKIAQHIDIPQGDLFSNPIDQLQRVNVEDAKQIREETLRERHTRVYQFDEVDTFIFKGKAEMLVWVDTESGLPAKIEIRNPDPKSPLMYCLDEFAWNEPLDAKLFSLDMPDGFTAGTFVQIPKPQPPASSQYADNPSFSTDGVLSRDRVPREIVWDPEGKTITALMRDPESTPIAEHRQNELRQWDAATGKLRWSKTIDGAGNMAQTADGKTLANVIGWEVQLRDAASGNITKTWATEERLSSLAFSPDGKTLAAGIGEWGKYGGRGGEMWGGVQLWDVEHATLTRTIKSDDKPVQFIRYSIDGRFLATSAGTAVKLWDVASGELVRVFPGLHRADFSPDSKTIACQVATSSDDKNVGQVDLYKVEDASLVKSFVSDKGPAASWVTSVTFSPDGRLLAATDWNSTVTLWDVAKGERKLTLTDHQAGVLSSAFSPDGTTLATGSEDKTLRLRKLPAK